MAGTPEKPTENIGAPATGESKPHSGKIDRTAPAGSENSLGAESVRDGRPDTKDDVVEAIDEEAPGAPLPPNAGNAGPAGTPRR